MGKGATTGALALALLLSTAGTARSWDRQSSLERSAATLTGSTPAVVCETPYEHAQGVKAGRTGYYAFTLSTRPALVVLAPSICRTIRRGDRGSTDFAHAAYVLAHELGHVARATSDETAAECYGLAHWERLAALLGLETPSPAQEARVAQAHDRLPARYRGACPVASIGPS